MLVQARSLDSDVLRSMLFRGAPFRHRRNSTLKQLARYLQKTLICCVVVSRIQNKFHKTAEIAATLPWYCEWLVLIHSQSLRTLGRFRVRMYKDDGLAGRTYEDQTRHESVSVDTLAIKCF